MNRKVAPIGSGMLSRTVRRGLDASAEGDFAKAFQFFQRAAASGEAEGAYRLGLLYLRGEGVVASPSYGIVWLRRAAKQGHAEAQYQLSLVYLHSGANPGIARWYHAASATHEDIAERNHALIFLNSFSVAAQPADAFRWCRAAALQGLVDAQAQLGFLYARGVGCDRDFAKARRWSALAAARGHAQAELDLGVIYENGADVAADPEVAAGWYERSAAKGNADAQIALALLCDSGRGVPSDPARAAALLEQATESGNPQAHYYFALHLLEGEGIVENRAMAETHLRKAAEQDLPEAQTALSNLCGRGGGVATDFTSELRLVDVAQANAQCTRGLCVLNDAEIHRPEEPQAIESAPVNELRSDYRPQLLRDSLPGSEPDIARPAGTHTTPDREIALHSGDQEWLRPHKFPGIARRIAFVALCTIAIASALIAGFSVLHGNHEVEAIITRILSNISSGTIPGSAAGPSEAVTEIPVSKKQVVIADSSQIPKPSRSAGLDSAVSGPPQRVAAGVQAKASATGSEAEASLKSEGGQLNAIEQSNHATAVSPDPAAHQPIPLIAHSTSIARREAPATARHLDTGPPGASESLEAEGTAPSDPTVLSEAPSITPTQAAKAADSEPGQTYATEPAGAAKTAPALVAAEAVGSGLEIPAVASAAADEAEHRLTEAGHSVNNAANLAVAAPAKHPDVALPPAHGMTDASRMSRATESTLEERRIKNAEADFLIMRGDAFFAAGDLTSARHFYEYAAAAGNGAAALRLGCTFDPAFLARAHVGRVQGDLPTTLYWYSRARDLGNADAETLLRGAENTMR